VNTLVVNAGSSSLKLRVVAPTDDVLASTTIDGWKGEADTDAIDAFARDAPDVSAVGHRVVHGGDRWSSAVVIDADVEQGIAALTDLAPLHQPRALAGIRAVRSVLRELPEVACFDTAFHATMPVAAKTYALPRAWREQWHIRRYGFHGLSHSYAARRAAELVGSPIDDLRVVTCHLGAGASLAAVEGGRSVDTTMGFTPLEGLVMATRSGSVDPGLVLWLVGRDGLTADGIADALAGLSGIASGDLRDVMAGATKGDAGCQLAFDVAIHRLRGEIAAMVAALGGLDVLVFTGGIGEHQPPLRQATIDGLAFLGLAIDARANTDARPDVDITAPGAKARTVVIAAGEEIEIARQVRALLS
jgi:acetate kinase